MGTPEYPVPLGRAEHSVEEELNPWHFYAAYVFDSPESRQRDITVVVRQAQRLGYPVRYWWLSEAMDIQESPDRLIVCVHHPSESEDAGMDLFDALDSYGALTGRTIGWDDLEAAAIEEYGLLGKPARETGNIHHPDGRPLFPQAQARAEVSSDVHATHYCWCGQPAPWVSEHAKVACTSHVEELSDPILNPEFAYMQTEGSSAFGVSLGDLRQAGLEESEVDQFDAEDLKRLSQQLLFQYTSDLFPSEVRCLSRVILEEKRRR